MAAFELSDDDRNSLVRVIQQSLGLQTQTDVFLWLHGEMQRFLPHETLVVAWGDFSQGLIHVDVISAVPGVCTPQLEGVAMRGLVRRLFESWLQYDCKPLVLESGEGFRAPDDSGGRCFPTRSLMQMRSVVIHGIRDQRGGQDCAYFAFGKNPVRDPANARSMIEVLIPYIDNSLRWVQELPEQKMPTPQTVESSAESVESDGLGLSMREIEIMEWVRKGKTNQEIGMILSISVFTVKNHLQRVFRKLNVLNRAQAVARTSDYHGGERA